MPKAKKADEKTEQPDETVQETSPTPASDPVPVTFSRDERGLLAGVDYKFKSNGRIDWEAMFNPEYYIYPDGDPSRDPLLKVDGLRDLAEIRGVQRKCVEVSCPSDQMVVCKVTFFYLPNFEDPNGKEWSAVADATPVNIGKNGFSKYLATIAETRATGRCHREALGIRLCSFEEVCPDDIAKDGETKPVNDATLAAIRRQMELKNVPLDALIKKIQETYPVVQSLEALNQGQAIAVLTFLNTKPNARKE